MMCDQAVLRGQYYRQSEAMETPVRLDGRVFQYLSDKAQRKGVSLEGLVNDILKKSIELSWRLES